MQLAYELLRVWAGQDEKLPTPISNPRRCSRVYAKRHPSYADPKAHQAERRRATHDLRHWTVLDRIVSDDVRPTGQNEVNYGRAAAR
jgi:hypothetical protein